MAEYFGFFAPLPIHISKASSLKNGSSAGLYKDKIALAVAGPTPLRLQIDLNAEVVDVRAEIVLDSTTSAGFDRANWTRRGRHLPRYIHIKLAGHIGLCHNNVLTASFHSINLPSSSTVRPRFLIRKSGPISLRNQESRSTKSLDDFDALARRAKDSG